MKRQLGHNSFLTFSLFSILLLFLWVVAGWNTFNYDYDNYSVRYDVIQQNGFNLFNLDFGYDLIQYFFIALGQDFDHFRIIIYFIGLLVIGRLIYRWSFNPLWVLLFYICYHFIRDIVETRNFLGSLFILFTIELMGRQDRRNNVYLFMLLFCAFSIHMSFILYFVFLVADRIKWNYWYVYLICLLSSFFAREILAGNSMVLLVNGMDDKIDKFMSSSPIFAFYLSACLAFGNGICIQCFHNIVKKCNTTTMIRHLSLHKYSFVIYNINALSNIFVILTPISSSFYSRLFGNIIILNVIYFLNVIRLLQKQRLALLLMLIIYIAFFLYFTQISPFWEHFGFIVSNNALFNLN